MYVIKTKHTFIIVEKQLQYFTLAKCEYNILKRVKMYYGRSYGNIVSTFFRFLLCLYILPTMSINMGLYLFSLENGKYLENNYLPTYIRLIFRCLFFKQGTNHQNHSTLGK